MMKWILSSVLLLIAIYGIVFAQRPTIQACPHILIDGPTELLHLNQQAVFKAEVSNYQNSTPLFYRWEISDGKILSGQGTPSLLVSAPDRGGASFEVSLNVEGLPDECPRSAKFSATVGIFDVPRPFDIYGMIGWSNERKRLDDFAIQLSNEENAKGYIVVYSKGKDSLKRSIRAKEYLINTHYIEENRLIVVNGGRKEKFEIKLWIIPNGASLPDR